MQPSIGTFTIPADHPSLPGHFPSRPIVPGVVLLDHLASLVLAAHAGRAIIGYPSVRFTRPIRPGDSVEAHYEDGAFTCTVDGAVALQGRLVLR